jgi:hypothetical protein
MRFMAFPGATSTAAAGQRRRRKQFACSGNDYAAGMLEDDVAGNHRQQAKAKRGFRNSFGIERRIDREGFRRLGVFLFAIQLSIVRRVRRYSHSGDIDLHPQPETVASCAAQHSA